jgi:hypothetical protein
VGLELRLLPRQPSTGGLADDFVGGNDGRKAQTLDVARLVTPGNIPMAMAYISSSLDLRRATGSIGIGSTAKSAGTGSARLVTSPLRGGLDKTYAARHPVRAGVDIVQAKRSAQEELKTQSNAAAAPMFKECALIIG